jgi:class 3 adenylate cyclase
MVPQHSYRRLSGARRSTRYTSEHPQIAGADGESGAVVPISRHVRVTPDDHPYNVGWADELYASSRHLSMNYALASAVRSPVSPLNSSVLLTDVAGFSHPCRDDEDRLAIRNLLYRIMRDSFDRSGVPWSACIHEDRGDGILTVAPPTVSTVRLVDPLIPLLAARLKRHNRHAIDPQRIKLRVALAVGPVVADEHGVNGVVLIHAARMIDAPELSEPLTSTGADLAVVVSDHVYQTVVPSASSGLIDARDYQRAELKVKNFRSIGWVYVGGTPT